MGWVFPNSGAKFIEFIEIHRILIDILERTARETVGLTFSSMSV